MKKQRSICGLWAIAFLLLDLWGYYESGGWVKRWMSNYGHDLVLPMFLYFFNRAVWPKHMNQPLFAALFVLGGTTAFEFAQLIGLYAGTFDPMDIVAYLAGIALALTIDAILVRGKERKRALLHKL